MKDHVSIELPGTYSTLIMLLLFFCMKFLFKYLEATNPTLVAHYALYEFAANSFFSGYFLGVAVTFLYRWYQLRKEI